IAVVAIDQQAALHVVPAATAGRDVYRNLGFHDVVAPGSALAEDRGERGGRRVQVGVLGLPAQVAAGYRVGRRVRLPDPAPLRGQRAAGEVVRQRPVRPARTVLRYEPRLVGRALPRLGGRAGTPTVGRTVPAADDRPTVLPVQRIDQRGPLGVADIARVVRVV